jgi:hypothetical protein
MSLLLTAAGALRTSIETSALYDVADMPRILAAESARQLRLTEDDDEQRRRSCQI